MLIITRRVGETLIIGETGEITLQVFGCERYRTKLGIAAPKEIAIHREEVYCRLKNEKACLPASSRRKR